MKHFVYRLTLLEPFDERVHYIGKRSCKGEICDIGIDYFTSSKRLKIFFKENTEKFKVKIVKIFSTSIEAVDFEGKYHKRLDVKRNKLFFNQQNQVDNAKGNKDRTGFLTVRNKISKHILSIPLTQFDREIYESINVGLVLCKNEHGESKLASSEEFINSNLVGINFGLIHVIEKSTNKKVTIRTEEYHTNKSLYFHKIADSISVFDKQTQKNLSITKEEFENENFGRYVGVRANAKSRFKICKYCSRSIELSNHKRHEETHEDLKNILYVTDNFNYNTIIVTNLEYYTNLKDTYYIIEGTGHYKVAYFNGEKTTLKSVVRRLKIFENKGKQNEN